MRQEGWLSRCARIGRRPQREFETAIRPNPRLYEAHYFYARTCYQQGKLEKAAELYEQAVRLDPDDYQAASLLVGVYRSLGHEAEATAALRRALHAPEKQIEFHPDDARALYMGAGALCEMGDSARSQEWVKRALQIDPDDTGILYNVACVYALLGETEEAINCLEKVLTRGAFAKGWAGKTPTSTLCAAIPAFRPF